MKKLNFKKIRSSPITEKILFAVCAVSGAYFTSLALDEELWKRPTLHILIFICAAFFDICLVRLMHKMLRRRVLPAIRNTARRAFSALFRRIGRIAAKLAGKSHDGKIFIEGKDERSFAVEIRDRKQTKRRKKLPALAKDANDREKARHAYTVFVFKRDKDISPVLTPSEVAAQLDKNGENADIFTKYNFARYAEEEKETRP
ncbi:MAG: hypothetical protein IKM00_06735 [Clostridia bacterium]|nr:hypothetical protein [Clostridia bacterium]